MRLSSINSWFALVLVGSMMPAIAFAQDDEAMFEDDPGAIAQLAMRAATGDWTTQQAALAELQEQYGPYAVNGLLRYLGSQRDVEERVKAIYALRRLGSESVLALVAGLHSSDSMTRRNLALVLGAIGDPRAAPALAAVAERDEDPISRAQAEAAVGLLGGSIADPVGQLTSMANGFLAGDPSVMRSGDSSSRVFFWNGKGIASRDVPPSMFGGAYAKIFAEAALRMDPSHAGARDALVAAYQRMSDAMAALADAEGGDDLADPEVVEAWQELMTRIGDLLLLGGAGAAVVELDEPEASANEAGYRLDSADKRSRYLAALSLAGAGQSGADVISTLAGALSESAFRNILVVDHDVARRHALMDALNDRTSIAAGAATGTDGLVRAKMLPPKDVIIVRADLPDLAVDVMVENLERDSRTRDLPVIVIAEEGAVSRIEGALGSRVVAVVPGPVNRAVILPAIDAAFEAAVLNDERMAAEDFSRRAAMALAAQAAGALGPAEQALVHAIGRSDDVQIPALFALRKVGPAAGQVPATTLFADETASTEARVAAAMALSGILARHAADLETLSALHAALEGDDQALKTAAARALGQASSLSAYERAELLLGQGLAY